MHRLFDQASGLTHDIIGAAIEGLGLPTLFVQEGGYICDALGDNLTSVLGGFQGAA